MTKTHGVSVEMASAADRVAADLTDRLGYAAYLSRIEGGVQFDKPMDYETWLVQQDVMKSLRAVVTSAMSARNFHHSRKVKLTI